MKGIIAIAAIFCVPAFCQAQSTGGAPQAGSERPNILVILADDLGWSDLGCYGNEQVSTPYLDRLASEGMRFTQAYAPAPICSPSRAAILTGRSPARLNFEFVTKPDGSKPPEDTRLQQPAFPRDLPLSEVTLGEVIDSDYRTGFFGKWHLTQENDRYLGWGEKFGPLQQGFDTGSENRGSHPYTYTDEEKKTFGDYEPGEFPDDGLTEDASAFLRSVEDRPFLLYFSMYYVHTPVRTRCRWLYDKYKALLGPDATEKQIRYAAFIETMDAYVGQLLEALEASGKAKNTVVVFLSDNGGHPDLRGNAPLRGSKWNLFEGGIRVPMIVRWPGVVQPGTTCQVPVTGMDIFPTVCAVSGSPLPKNVAFDGNDLSSLLAGRPAPALRKRNLYWHFPFYHPPFVDTRPQSAIRDGDHKLIYDYETHGTALFDLGRDPGETTDLSERRPRKARKLKKELMDQLQNVQARLPKEK